MELAPLRTFLAVARAGSLTAAAEEVHLSQPAVTRQLQGLERELGTRLLARIGRGVRLTAAGKALVSVAERIGRLEAEAREVVRETALGAGGRLTIAAGSTAAAYLLPELLRRFRAERRGVSVIVSAGLSAQAVEEVRGGVADVALATTSSDDRRLECRQAGWLETAFVLPAETSCSEKASLAEILAANNLILMRTGTSLRSHADSALEELSLSASPTMELDSVEAIKRMVEAGLGASLLPRIAVEAEEKSGRLRVISLPGRFGRQVYLVLPLAELRSSAATAFAEIVESSYREV